MEKNNKISHRKNENEDDDCLSRVSILDWWSRGLNVMQRLNFSKRTQTAIPQKVRDFILCEVIFTRHWSFCYFFVPVSLERNFFCLQVKIYLHLQLLCLIFQIYFLYVFITLTQFDADQRLIDSFYIFKIIRHHQQHREQRCYIFFSSFQLFVLFKTDMKFDRS